MTDPVSNDVWVKNEQTGTIFRHGLAGVEDLGDGYTVVESPDNPVPVAYKQKAQAAKKAAEEAQEADADAQTELTNEGD